MSTEPKGSAAHHAHGEIKADLLRLLERLDALGLHQAGAHLSMAIHSLESAPTGRLRVRELGGWLN